mgnify:CR=1 FL=1
MRTLFCLVVCVVALVAYVDRYGAGALETGASRAVKAAGKAADAVGRGVQSGVNEHRQEARR